MENQTQQEKGTANYQRLDTFFFIMMMRMGMVFVIRFLFVMMIVSAAALVFVLMVVMFVPAAAFMFMIMVVMFMTAVAFVFMLMVMFMPAATLVLMLVMIVSTAALVFVLMMVMPAAAFVFMLMMFVPAGTRMCMLMICMGVPGCFVSGINHNAAFHGPGDFGQFRNQTIRILSSNPQLLGGEGNGSFFHSGMVIKLVFNLGCAVGTVQIFNDVYFLCHRMYLLMNLIYEQSFMC